MVRITDTNLMSAFSGECQAHVRYLVYSDIAKDEGFANLSRLFHAVSFSERIHAYNHFTTLKDVSGDHVTAAISPFAIGKSTENLMSAISGERFEVAELYPAFLEVASSQDDSDAYVSLNYAYMSEIEHKKLFERALDTVSTGRDSRTGPVQVCLKCGYTIEGDAPDMCPICKAPAIEFKQFG